MGSKSSPSSSAMAEVRIKRNLLRLRTDSDSEEVFVMGKIGESSPSLLLDNASRLLLIKVVGLVLVLCVCDEDFMVVVVERFFRCWFEKVVV
jgi:hypothetical protein